MKSIEDNSNEDINRIIPIEMWEENIKYPINNWVTEKLNNQGNNKIMIEKERDDNEFNHYSLLFEQQRKKMNEYLQGKLCVSYFFLQ